MKIVAQLLAALSMCLAVSAHAQQFPQAIVDCKVGKQFTNVELGSVMSDSKVGTLRKAGMVGMRWGGGGKPVLWAKPEKQADGSFKVLFPGRKPMAIKAFRQLKDEYDTDAYLSIEEQGGQKFMCSQAMG